MITIFYWEADIYVLIVFLFFYFIFLLLMWFMYLFILFICLFIYHFLLSALIENGLGGGMHPTIFMSTLQILILYTLSFQKDNDL